MSPTARDLLAMKNSAVVYTCSPDASVAEASRMLRDRRVGCLVVTRGGAVLGLLGDREVATRVVAAGLDPDATRVRDVMSRQVPVAALDTPAEDLEAALRRGHVRHLPIVGDRGLLGVVSLGDLARFYALRERAARADAAAVAC